MWLEISKGWWNEWESFTYSRLLTGERARERWGGSSQHVLLQWETHVSLKPTVIISKPRRGVKGDTHIHTHPAWMHGCAWWDKREREREREQEKDWGIQRCRYCTSWLAPVKMGGGLSSNHVWDEQPAGDMATKRERILSLSLPLLIFTLCGGWLHVDMKRNNSKISELLVFLRDYFCQ